jgi:hypothetical protein
VIIALQFTNKFDDKRERIYQLNVEDVITMASYPKFPNQPIKK